MRRVLALVMTFTLWLALPAIAGGPNHIVSASPTADGAHMYRSGVQVSRTGTDSVTSSNIARATPSNCTGCEGVAVAFQAVIMTGNPSTVSPTNAAVAINSNCTSCKAFAFAYQYVVNADRGTHLSATGRAKISDIRKQAATLVTSGLPYNQLDSQLKALAVNFKTAVYNDLEHSGADPHDSSRDADTDQAPLTQ